MIVHNILHWESKLIREPDLAGSKQVCLIPGRVVDVASIGLNRTEASAMVCWSRLFGVNHWVQNKGAGLMSYATYT